MLKIFRNLLLAAALVLPSAPGASTRLSYLTIGPMIHINISGYAFHSVSYGLEAAYWNCPGPSGEDFQQLLPLTDKPGYGLALGIERGGRAIRVYAEPQVGWLLAGFSLGPVWEYPDVGEDALGIQGSGWANLLVGADLRFRRIGGKNHEALGLYAKVGAPISNVKVGGVPIR